MQTKVQHCKDALPRQYIICLCNARAALTRLFSQAYSALVQAALNIRLTGYILPLPFAEPIRLTTRVRFRGPSSSSNDPRLSSSLAVARAAAKTFEAVSRPSGPPGSAGAVDAVAAASPETRADCAVGAAAFPWTLTRNASYLLSMPGLAVQSRKGMAKQREDDDKNRLPSFEEQRVCASATGFTRLLGNASCSSIEGTPAAKRLETKDQESLDGHGHMQYLAATEMQGQKLLSRRTTKQQGRNEETRMWQGFKNIRR
jgi:hypothetical protein